MRGKASAGDSIGGAYLVLGGPGDVNGDHRPDLAVGATSASPHGRVSAGQVWVIEGAA